MSSRAVNGGLIVLGLYLSCRAGMAVAPAPLEPAAQAPAPVTAPSVGPFNYYSRPQDPAAAGNASDVPIPAAMALPANSTSGDTSTTRKFYTLSASLREVYDDNVTTSQDNPKSSLNSILSPSVLVDFPDANGDFTGRYTLGLTYYSSSPQSSNSSTGGNDTGQLEITHELVAQYTHAFSDRFSLTVAEDFRYFTEPSILQSTGTNYQNGPYYANTLNGNFSAQWTPLLGTTTTFSNTVIRYEDSNIGQQQDSIENTGSTSLGYSVLPKITASIGGIVDDSSYQSSDRGYTSYTGFGGVTWQALPSLSFSGRGGLTYIVTGQNQSQGSSSDSTAPYGALSMLWSLGARSSLSASYAHEVTPSDQVGTNGQISDRFNATFSYLITPRLTAHADGVLTIVNDSSALSGSSGTSARQENDYALDTGLDLRYNTLFSFDAGIILSGVSSNQTNAGNNNYTRDEAYVGVRGTY